MTLALSLVLILLFLLGFPLYLVIGGATLLAFNLGDWSSPSLYLEILRIKDSPTLMAIPLFTFTGFLMAKSHAPMRLVQLSKAFLYWLPGGFAVVALFACAVLTAFTGASGVTIIALGTLLYPSLLKEKYPENFVTGLLTTGGSRGLLFPPSLPLILYAVVIKESIDQLFLACLIPGLLGMGAMGLYCFWIGKKEIAQSAETEKLPLWKTLKESWMEIPLPIMVLGGIYSGWFTVPEASAISAFYALLVECFFF